MAKIKTQYVCQHCGAASSKWAGQCADCGEWNTLVETTAVPARSRGSSAAPSAAVQRLDQVSIADEPRTASGLSEMDRVLGGGIVPGAVILIGGDPGIGKSTLLLQVLAAVEGKLRTLYITGEESLQQVHLRAKRLDLPRLDLPVVTENGFSWPSGRKVRDFPSRKIRTACRIPFSRFD